MIGGVDLTPAEEFFLTGRSVFFSSRKANLSGVFSLRGLLERRFVDEDLLWRLLEHVEGHALRWELSDLGPRAMVRLETVRWEEIPGPGTHLDMPKMRRCFQLLGLLDHSRREEWWREARERELEWGKWLEEAALTPPA